MTLKKTYCLKTANFFPKNIFEKKLVVVSNENQSSSTIISSGVNSHFILNGSGLSDPV